MEIFDISAGGIKDVAATKITIHADDVPNIFGRANITIRPEDFLHTNPGMFTIRRKKDVSLDFIGNVITINNGLDEWLVMPDVTDIKTMNDRVVMVYFADGTKEKAVCDSEDTFSYEQGVLVCLMKKILSEKTVTNDKGSYLYNKLMNHVLAVPEKNRKKAEREAAEKERAEKAAQKKREKKERRKKKFWIDVIKEASGGIVG